MKILCLDIASKTGFAVFNYNFNEDFELTLINKGVFDMSKASPLHKRYKPGLEHPLDFINFIDAQMDPIEAFILKERPNIIVVEQTNKGRDRWRQKLLEWMHRELIWRIMSINENDNAIPLKEDGSIDEIKLYYLDTMEWRNILGIRVGKEERKSNKSARKLRAELKERKAAGEEVSFKGVEVIRNAKKVTIDYVNRLYGLTLKKKDDDIADAICLGLAIVRKPGIKL